MTDEPRILSLVVEADTQERWDADRRAWFPAGRLLVGAHVTLFYALPAGLDLEPALSEALDRAPFPVEVAGLQPLGRGVAYRVGSSDFPALHATLQEHWWEHLTKQDRQPLRAHVTVQNKVTPDQARETLSTLERDFEPWRTTALGLDLWRYDGGQWTHLRRHDFSA